MHLGDFGQATGNGSILISHDLFIYFILFFHMIYEEHFGLYLTLKTFYKAASPPEGSLINS